MSAEPLLENIIPAPAKEAQVNSYLPFVQYNPVIAGPDQQGRYLIVWENFGQVEVIYPEVNAQFYHANGARDGLEFRVNTETNNHQGGPDVCKLDDDSWVVVWQSSNQDGSRISLHFQRFNSTGPVGSETPVEPGQTDDANYLSVTKLTDDGFYVAWVYGDTTGGTVHGQRFDSLGNVVGSRVQISPSSTTLVHTDITQLPNNELLVVWADHIALVQNAGIYGQRMSVDGTKIGGLIKITNQQLPLSTNFFNFPSITLGSTSIIVTYATSSLGTYLQAADFAGNRIGPAISVSNTAFSDNLKGLSLNGKYTLVGTGDDGFTHGIIKIDNVPESFIIVTDTASNPTQTYPYKEGAPESATINLGRVLVNSLANTVTVRHQASVTDMGLLQFAGLPPMGVTLKPYDKDSGIIEISGPVLAVNEMPDLQFIPFPNADADVEISGSVAEDGNWANAISATAKRLVATAVNNPIIRSKKALPENYDIAFVLKDYFNDVEGFAGVIFKLYADGDLLYELSADGQVVQDYTTELTNVPLMLLNDGTAFKPIRQTHAVIYRVEAIDGPFQAKLEWDVPAFIPVNEPGRLQKGFILAGEIFGYVAGSVVAALIAYSPIKMFRNYLSRRAFSNEIDRKLFAWVDPENHLAQSVFWLLFAEPTIRKIFASGNFYRFRGGVSDREIEHLAEDLQTLFASLFSQGYQKLQSAALVDTIEQMITATQTHYQTLYDEAVTAAKAQIEREIEEMSPADDNDENAILLSTLADGGNDVITEKAKARVNDKKLNLMRKAVALVIEDNPLKARIANLRKLMAHLTSTVVHQHASKGGRIASLGKRLLRVLRIKSFGSSRTVNTNTTEILRKTLIALDRYANANDITIDAETRAHIEAQDANLPRNGLHPDSSYAVGLTTFDVDSDGETVNPILGAQALNSTDGFAVGVGGQVIAGEEAFFSLPPPLPHPAQAALEDNKGDGELLTVVVGFRNQ